MRSIGIGLALGAAAFVFTVATVSHAQLPPAPPEPPPGSGVQQPGAGPGVTVGPDGVVTTGTGNPTADQPQGSLGPQQPEKKAEPKKLPWAGSSLLFDQSATTQTVGVGKDYQSSNSLYEWWFSFRPRYKFYDDGTNAFNVNLRFDLITEMTNSDSTTKKRESQFGNTWINAVYSLKAINHGGWLTQISTGPRVLVPTDKSAYSAGQRLTLGWGAGLKQGVPLAGEGKTWFPGMSFSGSAYFTKNLTRATTAENPDFSRTRQDTGGRPLVSHAIGNSGLVDKQLLTVAGMDVDVTEKLHVGGSYIWIMQWTYPFGGADVNNPLTGPAAAGREKNPQNFRVLPWFLASIDYDIIPEVTLGAGYYNLNNQIGTDGNRRSPFWSPDARVFFDITANLDEVYLTLSGERARTGAQAKSSQSRSASAGAQLINAQTGL